MAFIERVVVESKKELLNHLKSQDITIPERTRGRTSQHCERRGVFRLLATLAVAERLEYPLALTHRDKPDFHLQFPHLDVGLEFTEAVSQEEAAIDAQAQRMGKSLLLFTDQFKKDMPRRTAKQRREIIENPPQGGPGWGDDRGVPQWIEWMMERVDKKTDALAKPDFSKYAENWLLIYDNLPVPFAQDTPKRWMGLNVRLEHYFSEAPHYGTVCVESGNDLARFARESYAIHPVVDLWS